MLARVRQYRLDNRSTDIPRRKPRWISFFDVFGQRLGRAREHGRFGMMPIEVFQRVTNRLDGTAGAAGNAPADLGRAGPRAGQPPGTRDDLVAFDVAHLGKLCAALDVAGMPRHKPLHRRFEEADPLAVPEHEAAAHQPAVPPPIDRLCRDLETLADVFDGQNLLGQALGLDVGAVGEILDEEAQIMRGIFAGDQQIRVHFRTIRGDPLAQILVTVILREIELFQKQLCLVDLLEPRVARRVPHLLFFQLPNCRILVV